MPRRKDPVDPELADVPKLPRGKGIKLSFGEIVRIGITATMLIAVLVLAQPCADAVGKFIGSFDPPDAQPALPPQKVPAGYVHLTPNMSQREIEQAIGAARDAGPIDSVTRGGAARDAGPIDSVTRGGAARDAGVAPAPSDAPPSPSARP